MITPAQSYSVDGFHAASNTVYEYNGCIFHGCRKCYPKQGNLKRFCHPDRTVDEVYEATLKKAAILREAGYNVVEMWGRDFAKQKETDPELVEFLETFHYVPPLEPRDALHTYIRLLTTSPKGLFSANYKEKDKNKNIYKGEREPRPFTQKLVRMRKSVMWISHPCTQVSTSMERILLVSRRSFISPKTRILASTLASRKLISWLPSGCTTLFCRSEPVENLLFLSAGHAFKKS